MHNAQVERYNDIALDGGAAVVNSILAFSSSAFALIFAAAAATLDRYTDTGGNCYLNCTIRTTVNLFPIAPCLVQTRDVLLLDSEHEATYPL